MLSNAIVPPLKEDSVVQSFYLAQCLMGEKSKKLDKLNSIKK